MSGRFPIMLACLALLGPASGVQPTRVPINRLQYTNPTAANNQAVPNDERVPVSKGANYELLDSEDRSLLDKFYHDARQQDPFQGDTLTSQDLWDGARDQELDVALADAARDSRAEQKKLVPKTQTDWTIDPELLEHSKNLMPAERQVSTSPQRVIAKYSPTVRLLTTYDPLEKVVRDTDQALGSRANRVVGATLAGGSWQAKPNVSSTVPSEAIRLHDELLEEPPRDGKVRVRMYFHRAIHDDPKLYGTGPWKYWGHGWGVEFGYDPKQASKGDYHEKGYSIERAFGRDFCRDKNKCRPPDDKF